MVRARFSALGFAIRQCSSALVHLRHNVFDSTRSSVLSTDYIKLNIMFVCLFVTDKHDSLTVYPAYD